MYIRINITNFGTLADWGVVNPPSSSEKFIVCDTGIEEVGTTGLCTGDRVLGTGLEGSLPISSVYIVKQSSVPILTACYTRIYVHCSIYSQKPNTKYIL